MSRRKTPAEAMRRLNLLLALGEAGFLNRNAVLVNSYRF